jgi:hypothetical protein
MPSKVRDGHKFPRRNLAKPRCRAEHQHSCQTYSLICSLSNSTGLLIDTDEKKLNAAAFRDGELRARKSRREV